MATYILGDANGDGVVSLLDAAVMRRFIAKWEGDPADTASIPAGADTLRVMFLNGDWSPAGPDREFDL